MQRKTPPYRQGWGNLAGLLFISAALAGSQPALASAQVQRYWCPDRPGAELQVQPGPGCEPFIPEKEDEKDDQPDGRQPISLDTIEGTVADFLARYREYLACCASDIRSSLERDELEQEASDILETLSRLPPVLFLTKSQGLIAPVALARSRLRTLKDQHKDLSRRSRRTWRLDYESAGRERRAIQEEREALTSEFQSSGPPSRASSGTTIGDSSFNDAARTGSQIGGSRPNQIDGGQLGNSTFNNSATTGTEAGDSSLNNSAIVDREIGRSSGTTGRIPTGSESRTGPAISNSSLNQR